MAPGAAVPLDGNAALAVPACTRRGGRRAKPGLMGRLLPAARPLWVIGLPLSIFTQQTGVLARQSLPKGCRIQRSWIQASILGSIESFPFLIPQNKLPSPTPTVTEYIPRLFLSLIHSCSFLFLTFREIYQDRKEPFCFLQESWQENT